MSDIQLHAAPVEYEGENGENLSWRSVAGFPWPELDYKMDWQEHNACSCGNTLFVVTYRPAQEIGKDDETGEPMMDRGGYRVVCPECIDYSYKEDIIGEIDYTNMILSVYDKPQPPLNRSARLRSLGINGFNQDAFDSYIPPGVMIPMYDDEWESSTCQHSQSVEDDPYAVVNLQSPRWVYNGSRLRDEAIAKAQQKERNRQKRLSNPRDNGLPADALLQAKTPPPA